MFKLEYYLNKFTSVIISPVHLVTQVRAFSERVHLDHSKEGSISATINICTFSITIARQKGIS